MIISKEGSILVCYFQIDYNESSMPYFCFSNSMAMKVSTFNLFEWNTNMFYVVGKSDSSNTNAIIAVI